MTAKSTSLKPVLIVWVDAEGDAGGWKKREAVLGYPLPKIFSLGFIIEETREFVHLAASISECQREVNSCMKIPKQWIKARI
jgi:hypothetical protein